METINEKTGRSLLDFKQGFLKWMEHHFRDQSVSISNVATIKDNGFSNETLIVQTLREGELEGLVVRLPPPQGSKLFPNYDFEMQSLIQLHLADNGIPTARPVAYVDDERWVGSRFLVMPLIDGRAPPVIVNKDVASIDHAALDSCSFST